MPSSEAENDVADEQDALVVRASTDSAALGALYQQYYQPIYRYCLHRLFGPEAAEDVTSDVFLTVAKRIGQFRGTTRASFCSWLYTIATNKAYERIRKARRRAELLEAAVQAGRVGRRQAEADNHHPDWPAVYQAILRLSPKQQTLVTLRFFEGLRIREIAEIVGRSLGAVSTGISRALGRVRDELTSGHPDGARR